VTIDAALPASARPVSADRDVIERIISGFRSGLLELRCISSERMVRGGVSMTHFHVMSMLERHGEMTMSRLAEMLDVSFSNATGLVDRMEERGLVERVRVADDRRVVMVRITGRGRELLTEVEVLRSDILGRVLEHLDDAQLERVARSMEDVRGALAAVLAEDPRSFDHDHTHVHAGDHPQGHHPAQAAASHGEAPAR
jgi:DNA-binding MarR family transcriptional regulator